MTQMEFTGYYRFSNLNLWCHGEGLAWQMIRWRNQVSTVAQLSKHFSAWDPLSGKPGWPAHSVKTSLGQRDKGQESPLDTERLYFPSHIIKGRFWASRSGMRSGTWWFWYTVRVCNHCSNVLCKYEEYNGGTLVLSALFLIWVSGSPLASAS